jgi:hypothetical protein
MRLLVLIWFIFMLCLGYSQKDTFRLQEEKIDSSVFDSEKRIFLVGEYHFINGNNEIEINILKYLYERDSVRVLLLEDQPSFVYFLKKYLASGNEDILDDILRYSGTEFYKKKFVELRNLPDSVRNSLIIVGIDVEKYGRIQINALYDILSNNQLSQELYWIKIYLDPIHGRNRLISWSWYKKMVVFLYNDFKKNELNYKLCLEQYCEYKNIIEGMKRSVNLKVHNGNRMSKDDFKQREILMRNNIIELDSKFGKKKMFGQFGITHVARLDSAKFFNSKECTSLSQLLNNDKNSPFFEKVGSYAIMYHPFEMGGSTNFHIEYLSEDNKKIIENPSLENLVFNFDNISVFYEKSLGGLFCGYLICKVNNN